jgi:hypothetical protein
VRRSAAAAIILAVTPSFGYSSDDAIAIRAPVSCTGTSISSIFNMPISCGHDTALAEVKQSHESLGKRLDKLDKRLDKLDKRLDKLDLRIMSFDACDQTGYDGPYVWARVGDYTNGLSSFEKLLHYAKSGEAFGERHRKYQIVEAVPPIDGEQHLAICFISNQSGPPRDCVTVAIITKTDTWLRGELGDGGSFGCNASGYSRTSGSIGIRYDVFTSNNPTEFAKAVSDLLRSRQNITPELTFYKNSDGSVYSIWLNSSAPLRDSKVLSAGWREAYDFDVYFGRKDHEELDLSIQATLRPMVSRLAGGSLTEYQGLDDAQRNTYSAFFDTLLGDAIKSACVHWTQIDGEKITCQR